MLCVLIQVVIRVESRVGKTNHIFIPPCPGPPPKDVIYIYTLYTSHTMDAAPCHFVSFSLSYPIIQYNVCARTPVEYVRYVYIYIYIHESRGFMFPMHLFRPARA